jgi:hypothetical protein
VTSLEGQIMIGTILKQGRDAGELHGTRPDLPIKVRGKAFRRPWLYHRASVLAYVRNFGNTLTELNPPKVTTNSPAMGPAPLADKPNKPSNVAIAIQMLIDDPTEYGSVGQLADAIPCNRSQLFNSNKFMKVWRAFSGNLPRGRKSADGTIEAQA